MQNKGFRQKDACIPFSLKVEISLKEKKNSSLDYECLFQIDVASNNKKPKTVSTMESYCYTGNLFVRVILPEQWWFLKNCLFGVASSSKSKRLFQISYIFFKVC